MARLAIAEACLTEYAKLDKHVQRAVDQAITTFARHPHDKANAYPMSVLTRSMPWWHGWRSRKTS